MFKTREDMESCGEDGEICVKLAPNLLEPEMLVKMAPGNRSQNFIDEVFRAAQSKSFFRVQIKLHNFLEEKRQVSRLLFNFHLTFSFCNFQFCLNSFSFVVNILATLAHLFWSITYVVKFAKCLLKLLS